MAYYIIFIVLILLSIFESFFKNLKLRHFLFFFVASIFFLLQCFNTWSPDFESYILHYDLVENDYVRSASEPIHIFIIEQSHALGFNFQQFFILYGILILTPFLLFVKKITPYPIFVLLLFYIIPFFPDIAQIRNFLAISLFFFGLLFYNNKKILFYLFFILSILSHYSMLSIAVFLLIKDLTFFKNYKKSNVIILTLMIFLTLVPKQLSDPIIIAINPKYSSYLETNSTYIGTVVLFLPFFLLNNFVIYHYNNHYKSIEAKIDNKYRKNLPIFISLIQYANYLIIFQYFIRDFSRITMNLSILSYIYVSIMVFYGWKKNKNNATTFFIKFSLILWGILTYYLIFLMLNQGEYLKVIEKTFSSNSFFNN